MTTAAPTPVRRPSTLRRPSAVRALTWLLALTAAATVLVDLLNWRYAPERGFGLAVRSGWALLRTLGFLLLIRQVRRARANARPVGLILAVTTVFAVGRLIVPRAGVPAAPGVLGFVLLTALCAAVVWLLYRSSSVRDHLVRHPHRLVVDRQGISWREVVPRRLPVTGWLLTARVVALTYAPLTLVPCLVAIGTILDGRLTAAPTVVLWFVIGVGAGFGVLFSGFFVLRGRAWAAGLLGLISGLVVAVNLAFCRALLGVDGLVRDGGPVVVAATVTLYALWRGTRASEARRASGANRPSEAGGASRASEAGGASRASEASRAHRGIERRAAECRGIERRSGDRASGSRVPGPLPAPDCRPLDSRGPGRSG